MSQARQDPMLQEKAELIRMLEDKFDIRDRNIIRALESVDRGDFLPEELKRFAYIDISLPVDGTNVIISYSDLMMAITSLPNTRRENALVIGRNSAFTAAILSFLYNRVYLIELNIASRTRVEPIIRGQYSNITYVFSNNHNHFNVHSPFDLVFINGSISEFTNNYINLLNQNGVVIFALSDRYGFKMLYKATRIGATYNITFLGEVMFPSLN